MTTVMGIDPGKTGGLGIIAPDRLYAVPLPYLDRVVDVQDLEADLNLFAPDKVIVEQQMIRAGQAGAMAIGANYGRILAVLELQGLPYRVVTPAQWSKRAGLKAGLKGREKKEAGFFIARQTWGREFDRLNLKPTQDGLVDALLIARFGAPLTGRAS